MFKRMTVRRINKLLAGMDGVNIDESGHVTIPMRDDDIDWQRVRSVADAASDKLNAVLVGRAYYVTTTQDANEKATGLCLVSFVPYEPSHLVGLADPMHY